MCREDDYMKEGLSLSANVSVKAKPLLNLETAVLISPMFSHLLPYLYILH